MSTAMKRYADALLNQNVQAFLRVLTEGESTQHPDAYRWLFGSTRQRPKLFDSFADHPRVRTYETYDGQFIKNGKIDFTTAAGRYQITETTWGDCLKVLGPGDFSPGRQDLAAVYLIDRRKALEDVLAGRFEEAVRKCAPEWASLPGAPYGQPTLSMERARATYERFGGQYQPTASAPAPEPIVQPGPEPADYHAPSGEAPEWTPPAQEPAMPVLPGLIKGLATVVIEGFSPLLREKLTKEMGRHTENSEVAEQIAETVVSAARTVTGLPDPVAAVAAVRADAAAMQRVEAASSARLEQLLPLMERLNAMEQANLRSAREYNTAEPWMVDAPWLKLKFIHLLSLAFVSFSGWFVVAHWLSLTAELRGAVITLMVIAGWNGVRDYWMGSSSGSSDKTTVINALAQQRK